jgi:hypothetical protein
MNALSVTWRDAGRSTEQPPNPAFPHGVDLDLSGGRRPTCSIALPYPAKGCGWWEISCPKCLFSAAATAAGRPDDPRSITVACREAA